MKIQLQCFFFFTTGDPLQQFKELHQVPEIPNVNVPERQDLHSVYGTVKRNKF